MSTISRRHHALLTALLVGLSLTLASTTLAQDPEQQGAQLFSEVERGQTDCADLDERGFTAIGEFVMGRMLGSPQTHEAMDRMMASMLGGSGLERMHEVMGQRLAGCGSPGLAAGAGPALGMMQMMGGQAIGGYGGMMGSDGRSGYGGMMGYGRGSHNHDDSPDAWMVILMLVLIAGVGAAAFAIARPRHAGSAPRDLLAQRFARGEMTTEEYEQRRALLEGADR